MSITGQETGLGDSQSPQLAEVLAYTRQQLEDGYDLSLTNAEAKLILAEFDRRLEHVDSCACEDCIADAIREAEDSLERDLNEQQADEDQAREVAENGVLPWE